ncbi:MAG: hypothetical protein QXT37_11760, partial [Thermofilaceae archaeon]
EQPVEEYKHTTPLTPTIIAATLLTIALIILAKRRERLRRPSLGGKVSHRSHSELQHSLTRS